MTDKKKSHIPLSEEVYARVEGARTPEYMAKVRREALETLRRIPRPKNAPPIPKT